ncbi:MAG: hypothetical protein H7Y42_02780 [Chitinophagaceae bacterium]|nr:hypothetical protein [Chitinophagaceae bacterium]
MKKMTLLTYLVFSSCFLFSQNFPGYRSGNYTGVNGVFYNPANIADSRYRWDVNLIGINGNLGNSQASFKLKNLGDVFNDNVDSLFFGNSEKESSGIIDMDIIGPSVMFSIGKKNSFAITTRFRAIGNVHDIDGNLIQSIDDENTGLPLTLKSNSQQKIIANGWTEIGGSFGRILMNKGKHFLKGGASVKFLLGSANSFANITNLKGTLDEAFTGDVYLTNASGRVAIGVAGVDFDNFESDQIFASNGNGIGFDLGLVYEYRPEENNSKYANKYKFRVGLALLDLGSITYKPKANEFGDYTINVPSGSQWFPSDLDGKSISEVKSYLDASPYFTNNAINLGSYKSNLPTTLQASVDYAINKHFYTELSGQLSLVSQSNAYSAFFYNAFTITPRYEGRRIGFALPINYNKLTNFNVGASFRVGPVFFGSGSVLTALVGNSKQADFHFGIRFGGLKK